MLLQIREGRVKNVTCAAAGQMLKVRCAVKSSHSLVRVMLATHRAACMYAVVRITRQPSDAFSHSLFKCPALLLYLPEL